MEVDWQGPGDYQLRRLDGVTSLLGCCNTPEQMLEALLDSDWSPELEGARVERVLP